MEEKKTEGKQKIPLNGVIALGMVGILLVAISGFWGEEQENPVPPPSATLEMEGYITETESRIALLLSSIAEVGKSNIMLTLESGGEYIYAKNEKLSPEDPAVVTESSYILVDTADGRQALVTRQLSPKIKGVVVVCQGGDNPLVKERISEVLSTALGIKYLQISVQKLAD